MKAGKLDRRVSILRHGPDVDDGYTTLPGELGVMAQRWASWKPANGREVFENQGREAKAGGTFWLRYDSDTQNIVETDKVAFDGRVWDIHSIAQIGRTVGVELTVSAEDGQQEVDVSGLAPVPSRVSNTGWAYYIDGSGTQALTASVRTMLTNDATTVLDAQKPSDIPTFWTNNAITGLDGDDRVARLQFTVTPTDGVASKLLVEFDIGGDQGVIDQTEIPLTGGQDIAQKVSEEFELFCGATFEANGCSIYLTADGPVEIDAKQILVKRGHKAV